MKKIRIASGIRRIEEGDINACLFRLRDVLTEHRNVFIGRILSDIGTYVEYRFSVRLDIKQQDAVRDHLQSLRTSVLDLERYREVVEHFNDHEMTHVRSEPFMREIDEHIAMALNLPQLKLVG